MIRRIIHLDLDAFFCAVEELRDPALNGIPFAVGGRPEGRGVVTSASYAARKYGVKSAMPMSRAVRVCPSLKVVSGHYSNYRDYSQQVMSILREASPLVEQISIDEAFLDVSDFNRTGKIIANYLQTQIRDQVGLPSSLGVATNKLVAKIATNVGKASHLGKSYPNAILVIPPGEEASFLAPLPCEALWGVGPKTAARLSEFGIKTIGDIATWPANDLIEKFGRVGEYLSRRSKGIDIRPISTHHDAKSISHESTFHQDLNDEKLLLDKIRSHSKSIAKRLKKSNVVGTTVKLKLRWPDFTTFTRQVTLSHPTDDAVIIFNTAKDLLLKSRKPAMFVRLIGVGITNLQPPIKQLSLWDAPKIDQDKRLENVVNELKMKYGSKSIGTGKEFKKNVFTQLNNAERLN